MSGFIQSTLQGIGQDFLQDKANEYAESHFQPTKDPFYQTIKISNDPNEKDPEMKEVRLKLPKDLNFTKKERKAWKSIQNKAWLHDRSLCGCCCWFDTIGWGPLLSLIPVIGPFIMYWVHNKLIELADKEFQLPIELKAKMHGNIVVDLCISLIPILGTLFSWLHTCSTRNAAMVYNYIVQRAIERQQQQQQNRPPQPQPRYQQQSQSRSNTNDQMKSNNNRNYNRNNDRNNRFNLNHEKYEMNHMNNNNNNNMNQSFQSSKIIPPRQVRYKNDYSGNQYQQYSRREYNRPINNNNNNHNNQYYEPNRPNLPYPTEETEFY